MKKGALLIIFLLILTGYASAENHYVTQDGAGSMDGSSSGNAWRVSDFNDAANWNTAANTNDKKIGPGDTVYFSGTITSDAIPKEGGTAGNLITLDGLSSGDGDPLSSSSRALMATFNSAKISLNYDYIGIQDFVFENNKESIDSNQAHKFKGLRITRNYIEIATTYQTAISVSFLNDCEISYNYAYLPNMPSYPDCSGMGRFVRIYGGSRNTISHNTIDGGMTAIIFLAGLNWGGLPGPISIPSSGSYTYDPDFNIMDNEVAYNNILNYCEEGISYDIAAQSNLETIIDRDTVSSINGNQVTLSNPGWSGAGYKWSGAYMISLAERNDAFGQDALIESQSDNIFTLASPLANLQVGDIVTIAFVFKHNWIHGNVIAPNSNGFGHSSINLYGPALNNLIENNKLGYKSSESRGIKLHGNTGFFVSDFGVTGTSGSAPAAFNIVRDNNLYYISDFVYDFNIASPAYSYWDRNNAIYNNNLNGNAVNLVYTVVYCTDPPDTSKAQYYTLLGNDPTSWSWNTTQTYSCTGTIPSNAAAYDPEESSSLTVNTPWTYSASDTTTNCQYHCNSGYNWDGSSCTQQTQTDPVAYWNFDEGTGIIAHDSSGNSNDGTLTNGPVWAAGKIGSHALSFDGANDYVNVPADSSLEMGISDWTVGAWIYVNNSQADYGTIMAKGAMSDSNVGWAFRYYAPNDGLSFSITGGGSRIGVNSNNNLGLEGAWHYAVVSIDRSSDVHFYSDGISAGGGSLSSKDGVDITNAGQVARIGAWGQGTPNYFFNGKIDDVEIWNRALSASEILNLYNQDSGSQSQCNNPADTNSDGFISISELINYISRWKAGSVTIGNLIDAIGKWKDGC